MRWWGSRRQFGPQNMTLRRELKADTGTIGAANIDDHDFAGKCDGILFGRSRSQQIFELFSRHCEGHSLITFAR